MLKPIPIPADVFITTQQLIEHTLHLAQALGGYPIKAVLACARSGLLPGSILATQWHVPLFTVSPKYSGVTFVGRGYRLDSDHELPKGMLLLIDDTVNSGHTFYQVINNNPELYDRELLRAAVYVAPEALQSVDFAACVYPRPHYLEWCFANTFWAQYLAFDLDGIICEDPVVPDQHPQFWQHLIAARPVYLPRKYPVVIVSARCEIFRRPTEFWLKHHRVNVKRMILWPGPGEDRWKTADTVVCWKVNHLRQLLQADEIRIYIESDPAQAKLIADMVPMAVICPRSRLVYNQHLHTWKDIVVS